MNRRNDFNRPFFMASEPDLPLGGPMRGFGPMRGGGPMMRGGGFIRGGGPMRGRGYGRPEPIDMFSNYRRRVDMDDYNDAYGDYQGGYPIRGSGGPPQQSLPPPPPPAMNQSSAYNYLLRCGMTRDQMKGWPKDYFTFITPESCGICCCNFDSFAQSRIHYVSKSHLKKSRKWLGGLSDFTGITFDEKRNPLRSRDLYCELCDVQITSKVHAESHYSGRQHKAIVLRRRDPKNQVLLLPENEGRMNQLIRREKRFMKNLDEDVNETEKTEEKSTKPVDPSLYCDICNTSVTCSEQMTAHMNGKKHLTKEKNFILRMMKGDSTKKQDSNENQQVEEQSVENEVVDLVDEESQEKPTNPECEKWAEGGGENW